MFCIYPNCKSSRKRQECEVLSFHRFPKDPQKRQAWFDLINQPNAQLRTHDAICSNHFRPDDYEPRTEFRYKRRLKNGVVPVEPGSSNNTWYWPKSDIRINLNSKPVSKRAKLKSEIRINVKPKPGSKRSKLKIKASEETNFQFVNTDTAQTSTAVEETGNYIIVEADDSKGDLVTGIVDENGSLSVVERGPLENSCTDLDALKKAVSESQYEMSTLEYEKKMIAEERDELLKLLTNSQTKNLKFDVLRSNLLHFLSRNVSSVESLKCLVETVLRNDEDPIIVKEEQIEFDY